MFGIKKVVKFLKGGQGSGNFGHAGRPGEVGGSAPEGEGGTNDFIGVKDNPSLYGEKLHTGNAPTQPGGAIVRGTPISPDDPRIPDTVYHVTTNLPAVQESGVLLAGGKGGLGGDNEDRIVSMTIDKSIAEQLEKDIKLTSSLAREFAGKAPPYTWDDKKEEWVGDRTEYGKAIVDKLNKAAEKEGWKYNPHPQSMKSYNLHDYITGYFIERESKAKIRNPVFFSTDTEMARVDPERVGIVSIPKKNLKTGAMLTDFDLHSKSGLKEIRSYGNVPLKPKNPDIYKGIKRVTRFLKGGAGSGNFGHAGRPGEVGGSAKEGTGGFTRESIVDKINNVPIERRAMDSDYVSKVKELSRLSSNQVSMDKGVSDTGKLAIYEQVAALPDNVKNYIRERGTWIRVLSERENKDEIPTTMEGKFYKYGEADYSNNTITLYEYEDDKSEAGADRVAKTTSHEFGHMAVFGIAGNMAEVNAAYNERNDIWDDEREFKGDKNSEEYKSLKRKLDKANEVINEFPVNWPMLWHEFGKATHEEGGVTSYAQSHSGSGITHKWESKTESLLSHKDIFGKANIKLYHNENFSEFVKLIHGGSSIGGERKTALQLKKEKPKSFKAFMKLYNAVKRHGFNNVRLWPR